MRTRIQLWLTIILLSLVALSVQAAPATEQIRSGGEVNSDLGDAPDKHNHVGVDMTAYGGAVVAEFPTVFDRGGNPPGPIHYNNQGVQYYLGPNMTGEQEADQGFDTDVINNLDPAKDRANQDRADDGLRLPKVAPPACELTTLQYFVTVKPAAVNKQVFVNLWFDWDHSGKWGEVIDCDGGLSDEWGVQNQMITLPATPGMYVYTTTAFRPGFDATGTPPPIRAEGTQPLWVRISLSEQAAPDRDGSGVLNGYEFGETEDYLYAPEMRGIHGTKYHDLNGNGVRDAGEPGLAGWEIILTGDSSSGTPGLTLSTATNEVGNYWFTDLPAGHYTIKETNQAGWVQTAPASGQHTVQFVPEQSITGLDFGNWEGDPTGACDLAIQKRHEEGQALSYDSLAVYQISVGNVGDGVCEGPITVTDALPESVLMPVGAFNVGPWACDADANNPQTITCTHPGPIVPGATLPTITLNVQIPPFAQAGGEGWNGDSLFNCATVVNPNDQNPDNNRGCDQAAVITPNPNEWCNSHWDVHIPPAPINELKFWLTIHNGTATAQTYNIALTGTGVTGLNSFTTVPAMPVTVAANSFLNIVVIVDPKPVVNVSPVAPYSVIVTNTTGNYTFSCGGNIWNPGSDVWFWANTPNDGTPLGIPFGSGGGGGAGRAASATIEFPIHNLSQDEHVVNIRIDSMGMETGGSRANPISLNGSPAGDSVLMTDVIIPAGQTTLIPVSVEFLSAGDGDVILYMDADQNNSDDTSVSVYVYSTGVPTAVGAWGLLANQQPVLLAIVVASLLLGIATLVIWRRKV